MHAWRQPRALSPVMREADGGVSIHVPLFIFLLKLFDYPDADQLFTDLTFGFELIGSIPPGVGWPLKLDNGPLHPGTGFAPPTTSTSSFSWRHDLQSVTPTNYWTE